MAIVWGMFQLPRWRPTLAQYWHGVLMWPYAEALLEIHAAAAKPREKAVSGLEAFERISEYLDRNFGTRPQRYAMWTLGERRPLSRKSASNYSQSWRSY